MRIRARPCAMTLRENDERIKHRAQPLKIFVTGGTGFTGREFAAYAVERGHEVVAPTIDLTDAQALARTVSDIDFDAVAHFAAVSGIAADASAIDFYNVNTIGTLNLLEAIVARGSKKPTVLLASSASVYGNAADYPISESFPPAPTNHYGSSKLAMEYLAKKYTDHMSLFIVRPFNYTGPTQNEKFLIPKLVRHFVCASDAVRLGNIDIAREFNDVRFVCEAYLRLIARAEPNEIYNICSGQAWSLSYILTILTEITGHKIKVEVDPNLVRPGEIKRLAGDPHKLDQTIGEIERHSLRDTLRSIIDYQNTLANK
jgi:nucleoside-diphosphate-sugar epimerase